MYPWPNFIGVIAKRSSKLGNEWIITLIILCRCYYLHWPAQKRIILSALDDKFVVTTKCVLRCFPCHIMTFCLAMFMLCQDEKAKCLSVCFSIILFEAGHVQTVGQIVEFDWHWYHMPVSGFYPWLSNVSVDDKVAHICNDVSSWMTPHTTMDWDWHCPFHPYLTYIDPHVNKHWHIACEILLNAIGICYLCIAVPISSSASHSSNASTLSTHLSCTQSLLPPAKLSSRTFHDPTASPIENAVVTMQ